MQIVEIYADLSRESNNVNKKRHKESESSSKSTAGAKRSKTISRDAGSNTATAAASENTSSQPKRSVTLARNENLPYIEYKLTTSNPIGMPVTRYSKNTNFKDRLVKTKQDKYLCAGQAFAKELMDRPGWNVKFQRITAERVDYVIYKECHYCNSNELNAKEWHSDSNELDAKEGVIKFTGYEKLAKYVYEKGMVEELTKSSNELKEFLGLLGLSCENKTAAAVAALKQSSSKKAAANPTEDEPNDISHNNNETLGTVQASMVPLRTATTNNNCTQTLELNASPRNSNQTVDNPSHNRDIVRAKRNELKEAKKQVDEKLSTARAKYISVDETWKRDSTVDFFNTLDQWLYHTAKDRLFESFSSAEFQDDIDEFESCMADLEAAEENGDDGNVGFHREMVSSWVEMVKKKHLPSST